MKSWRKRLQMLLRKSRFGGELKEGLRGESIIRSLRVIKGGIASTSEQENNFVHAVSSILQFSTSKKKRLPHAFQKYALPRQKW